jgi:hypothetical protein
MIGKEEEESCEKLVVMVVNQAGKEAGGRRVV